VGWRITLTYTLHHDAAPDPSADRLLLLLLLSQVTEGWRITLTYTLHRDAAPDPSADMLLLRASELQRQLAAALADKEFMAEGETCSV
jgi:hypothetical protein